MSKSLVKISAYQVDFHFFALIFSFQHSLFIVFTKSSDIRSLLLFSIIVLLFKVNNISLMEYVPSS